MSAEPKTFDEVAKQIAKEKGISISPFTLAEEQPTEREIPLSVIEEDNHKIRTVIKTLEEWRWHPYVQKEIRLYIECVKDKLNIVNTDEQGKSYNSRSSFEYLHYELNQTLFFYRDAVNKVLRNEDYNFSIRKKIILFLGCKCLFCGNEDIDYLQLDHKKGQGGKERHEFKSRRLNAMLYYWENLIDAYLRLQVLCLRCHKLKSTYRIRQAQIDEKVKESEN